MIKEVRFMLRDSSICLIVASFIISLFWMNYAAEAGQSAIVVAEGYSCMGVDKSRRDTETEAKADAKRNAVEKARTLIISQTQVKDFQVEKDLIEAYAQAQVTVIEELKAGAGWHKDPSSGDCFKYRITAEVVPDEKAVAQIVKKRDLLEKRRRLEEEREGAAKKGATVAMSKLPDTPMASETGRDVRFIAFRDGTVLDRQTNLMWAAKDNGYDINWKDAKSYCENYRGSGYSDWRMPMLNELKGLYDAKKRNRYGASVTDAIEITHLWVWTLETHGSSAAVFDFYLGTRDEFPKSATYVRAIPVRSTK